MNDISRYGPFGGAYGAAWATRAGDLVFTSVGGVIGLRDGVPVFAARTSDTVFPAPTF